MIGVKESERALLNHVSMFGSDGYPVSKVGSRHWSWSYRELSCPVCFPTKRQAVASFEAYMDAIRERWAEVCQAQAIAEQAEREARQAMEG